MVRFVDTIKEVELNDEGRVVFMKGNFKKGDLELM